MNQTQHSHIVSAYGAELEQLSDDLLRMGGLVETQLNESVMAFSFRIESAILEPTRTEDSST